MKQKWNIYYQVTFCEKKLRNVSSKHFIFKVKHTWKHVSFYVYKVKYFCSTFICCEKKSHIHSDSFILVYNTFLTSIFVLKNQAVYTIAFFSWFLLFSFKLLYEWQMNSSNETEIHRIVLNMSAEESTSRTIRLIIIKSVSKNCILNPMNLSLWFTAILYGELNGNGRHHCDICPLTFLTWFKPSNNVVSM